MTAHGGHPARTRDDLAITRADVEAALADSDWQAAAAGLGISPGLAFMIRTGIPADGSGVPPLDGLLEPRLDLTTTQHLVNASLQGPTRNERVAAWIADRAARELTGGAKSGNSHGKSDNSRGG